MGEKPHLPVERRACGALAADPFLPGESRPRGHHVMPSNDSDADGRIDDGDVLAPGEHVVCPACGETSTDRRTCEHCGHGLTEEVGTVARSFSGP
jgi:hypothetical protein